MAENIEITYQTLFDMLRREKTKEPLQKLESGFYNSVFRYLKDKEATFNATFTGNIEEKDKYQKQVYNIKKILLELYEKRESKIVKMALDKSRVEKAMIDMESMLTFEKDMFNTLLDDFKSFKFSSISNILNFASITKVIERPKEMFKSALDNHPAQLSDNAEKTTQDSVENKTEDTKGIQEPEKKEDFLTIRFIGPVPQFVGEDLEPYGPFDVEDIAKLPLKIASVLVEKGRAEEMSKNP